MHQRAGKNHTRYDAALIGMLLLGGRKSIYSMPATHPICKRYYIDMEDCDHLNFIEQMKECDYHIDFVPEHIHDGAIVARRFRLTAIYSLRQDCGANVLAAISATAQG